MSSILLQNISKIDYKKLTWESPLANGIISNENEFNILGEKSTYEQFMKPANKMLARLSDSIKKQCNDFIKNYKEEKIDSLKQPYTYNNEWKENNEELKKVTDNILNEM